MIHKNISYSNGTVIPHLLPAYFYSISAGLTLTSMSRACSGGTYVTSFFISVFLLRRILWTTNATIARMNKIPRTGATTAAMIVDFGTEEDLEPKIGALEGVGLIVIEEIGELVVAS